jgi:hypothetical protein
MMLTVLARIVTMVLVPVFPGLDVIRDFENESAEEWSRVWLSI